MTSRIRHELAARDARQKVNQALLQRHHELQVFRDHIEARGRQHHFDEQAAAWGPVHRVCGPGHL
ncbi:MAG: hypothetical protein ACT452_14130, partial [Microthrixaceae bacterium]